MGEVVDPSAYGDTMTAPRPAGLSPADDAGREVIVDPSILLSVTGFDVVASFLAEEPSRVAASSAFVRLVLEGWDATQPLLEHFLADGDEPIDAGRFDHLRHLVQGELIRPYSADPGFAESNAVARGLARMDLPAELRDILVDEWVFLQSHSWLGARAKKTLDWFKKAGAQIVEYSADAWNYVRREAAHEISRFLASEETHHQVKWIAAAAIGVAVAAALTAHGFPVPPELTAPVVEHGAERVLLAVFDP
ncbi:MAG TPA: hypothetical protein VE596_14945 [Gaiellaceae bacterium]|nr:hypothetical protein [Gaiellaceae bacterium]